MKVITLFMLVLTFILIRPSTAGEGFKSLLYEGFESISPPSLPPGWLVDNANGDLATWQTRAYGGAKWGLQCIRYARDLVGPADDWVFTPGVSLTSTETYTLEFLYRASSALHPEVMDVFAGTGQDIPSMVIPLWSHPAIVDTEFVRASVPFSVPSSGTHYFGFHAASPPGMRRLHVDDVNLLVPQTDLDMRIGMVRELYEDGIPTYSPEDTIECLVYVKNVGSGSPIINKRFFIGTGIRETELEFEIIEPYGDTLDIIVVYTDQRLPEASDFAPLPPDSLAFKYTNLWEWYLFENPGDYTIKAYYRSYADPGSLGAWMGELVTDPMVIRID